MGPRPSVGLRAPYRARAAGSGLTWARSCPLSPVSCPGKERPAACSGRAPGPPALAHADSDELSRGNLEVGFRPQKSVKAEREPNPAAAEDRQPAGGASDAEAVARPARSEEGGPAVSPGLAASQSCSPGWSSAFYEEDCFGADIRRYVQERELQRAGGAPHTPSPVSPGPPAAHPRAPSHGHSRLPKSLASGVGRGFLIIGGACGRGGELRQVHLWPVRLPLPGRPSRPPAPGSVALR